MLCTCNKNILVKLLKLVRLLKNLQKFFSNRDMATSILLIIFINFKLLLHAYMFINACVYIYEFVFEIQKKIFATFSKEDIFIYKYLLKKTNFHIFFK